MPSTHVHLARQKRWRQALSLGYIRRQPFRSIAHKPNLALFRGRSQFNLPDKGVHDDEEHWDAFIQAEGKGQYVSMPYLGQGKSQRHTSRIKLYRVSINGALHVLKSMNPETILVQVFLMWAYRPNGGAVPKFTDLFTCGGGMDDQQNPACAKLKHPMSSFYKILARKTIYLQPYTNYCPGFNRKRFTVNLKFTGRNTNYVVFGDECTGGAYTDIRCGGLFYYVRFVSSDAGAQLQGDWNCRIMYFH